MTTNNGGHRRFDPWLRACDGSGLARVVAAVHADILSRERRARARKPVDAKNFADAVCALLANLARAHLTDCRAVAMPAFESLGRNARPAPSPFTATTQATSPATTDSTTGPCIVSSAAPPQTMHRKDRYRAPVCGAFLPQLLASLADAGYVVLRKGTASVHLGDREPTTVKPALALVALFGAREVSLQDIQREPGEELVLLKADKDEAERAGELLNYFEGELSTAYRQQVRELNAWLASADITYTGPERVAVRDRHLVRRFTCGDSSFSSGGRLWGGWWYGLSKQQRHEGIRIGGEHVVGLDFKEMAVRTTYAMLRQEPPDNGYTLGGRAAAIPRATVKRLVSAALFHNKGGKRLAGWPGADVVEREAMRAACNGLRLSEVLKAIEAKHAAIARHFYRGIGHQTQHTESEIVLHVLYKLRALGVVALPVHDCIYVPASTETVAVRTMAATWEEILPALPARITVEWMVNGRVEEYEAWNAFHMTAAERAQSAAVEDAHRVPAPIVSDIREPEAIDVDDPTKGKSRAEARALVGAFIDREGFCPAWMPRWMT